MSYISEIQDTIPRVPNYFGKIYCKRKCVLPKIDEKLTALFIGLRWVQNCETRSRNMEGEHSRTQIGFNTHIYEGSNKMRFQHCMNSKKSLLYIRAIQGNTGGNLIAPELMGHVAIPYI